MTMTMTMTRTTTTTTTTTMTTTTETTARPAAGREPSRAESLPPTTETRSRLERLRFVPSSLRARIVTWFIAVLALSTVGLVVVTYEVTQLRLDQRIDADLRQEIKELRKLSDLGNDPLTGKRFTTVKRIFDVYLARNVASNHEVLITFAAGEPYLKTRQPVPYELDRDPEIVARWANLTKTNRGAVETPAGRVEYLALPLKVEAETAGVFVAAVFRDRANAEGRAALYAAGAVALGVLLLGSLLAWRLADRLVRPVTDLTATARSISETDLDKRIPVEGKDEVAQLASTFNDMLDRLQRAFAAQRRFADDASHELKTPLTIIRGHLELLDEDPVERAETLALVTDELDRMGRIVEDLLLLARREEPDFLALATLDVGDLTESLFAKAAALAPREWVLDVRGQGVIVGDRQRLTQAMMQLAENAARYADGDGPIAIGSLVSGGEARLWVRDRGPGIPVQEREAIFERFRRGEGTERSDGAGLGLAIVKTIAEAHHGRVELETGPGGSVFTIVVPVDQPTEALESET
jgi:signal transduction histidine kinase